MSKIIIDCNESIIRTAVLENDKLAEIIIDKKENKSLVGNIYSGIVQNILPSQFAFIDIGRNKNGFLFLNDKKEAQLYNDKNKLKIKTGDSILVQVVKDETGQKGAYVTNQISFSGRLCVLIKSNIDNSIVAISKKIIADDERKRLKKIANEILPSGYELILRTNCENKSEQEIKQEVLSLLDKASDIHEKWKYLKSPCIVDKHENAILKNLKDLFNEEVEEIVINNVQEYENIKISVKDYFTSADERIKLYNDQIPIFQKYSIDSQISKALNKKVWLKSGGFLIIEQTEACAVIDVNSGKFSGKKNHEQSSLGLNIEAGIEIAKQIRLRNICGIIIVDFIDLKTEESKKILAHEFDKELKKDRISTNLVGMTSLGLMEITRKKMREPLVNILKQECKSCGGTGKVIY